jgi:tRNA (mo5U34)-methyltransferase
MAQIRWFHSIDLGQGLVTPGAHVSAERLPPLHLPEDLTGKTVLDVCTWDGFFAFEAERRGAARVVAVDSYCWSGPGWGTRAGFDLACAALDSHVEGIECDVLDLDPARLGTFDLVLCLGVLYHMRHPLLMLERVAAVCHDQLILQTQTDLTAVDRPVAAFYPGSERGGDATNWWGLNPACVEAMLRVVGFRRVTLVDRSDPPPARAVSLEAMQNHYATWHAWKH